MTGGRHEIAGRVPSGPGVLFQRDSEGQWKGEGTWRHSVIRGDGGGDDDTGDAGPGAETQTVVRAAGAVAVVPGRRSARDPGVPRGEPLVPGLVRAGAGDGPVRPVAV